MSRLDFDEFVDLITQVIPGEVDIDKDTVISHLGPGQRLGAWRWLTDAFDQSADFEVIRTYRTFGEAWEWINSELEAGASLRTREVRAMAGGQTTRVRLRPIEERDLVPLYEASMDPAQSIRWRFRGVTISLGQFAETLYDSVRTQFIVEMAETREPVGLVVAYEHNDAGAHCKIGFLRIGDRAGGDAGAVFEGLVRFLTHLFQTYPYRKVFAEIPTYNMSLLEGIVGDLMTEEGCLRDYLFAEGAPVDMHYLSMSREQWQRLYDGWAPPAG